MAFVMKQGWVVYAVNFSPELADLVLLLRNRNEVLIKIPGRYLNVFAFS